MTDPTVRAASLPGQLDLLDEVNAHADETWKATARQALEHLARTGRTFQAHDLISLGVPEPADPRSQWGALMSAARKDGLIVKVGAVESNRPETRGSLVRLWRGA